MRNLFAIKQAKFLSAFSLVLPVSGNFVISFYLGKLRWELIELELMAVWTFNP